MSVSNSISLDLDYPCSERCGSNICGDSENELLRLAEFRIGNKLGLLLGFPSDECELYLSVDFVSSTGSMLLIDCANSNYWN